MKRGVYLLRKFGWLIPIGVLVIGLGFLGWYVSQHQVAVFAPAGEIGLKERNLMVTALIISAIVVVPVFAMTIAIAWRYRENNRKPVVYQPEFDRSRLLESIWWGVPIFIIAILSVIAWNSAHTLDPYKAVASTRPILHIQVVAMDWKWLFIYPEQHLASVNLAVIPVGTPVDFAVTSDTVMNSFWVPQLGGQIYAMPGMKTHLNELAMRTGDFLGSPANIAGTGFASMDFTVRATHQADFDRWVRTAQQANRNLTTAAYAKLAKPSDNLPVSYYSPVQDGLFADIIGHYMAPAPPTATTTKPQPIMEMTR